ncbi:hypothetical protein DCAR_0416861 [Daucus carota subsp. sativus]|uniref:Uncharacterized protein n=1 Tax=Daucus carota subsp. sativus TaxID=79200 RepID=A0A165XUR0_DAUCS|nr:hypothetical protein DCAR_0416861 [Daucus carota subsp. sativus]
MSSKTRNLYSSLPSQETKTRRPLKQKNPFKKILSKAKKIFSRGKAQKQEINEVEDIDLGLWWKDLIAEIIESGETPVDEKAIKKTPESKTSGDQEEIKKTSEAKTRKQELQEEETVGVQGEVNVVEEIPTGETQAKGEDNVDDLLLQMRQTKIKEKSCVPLPCVSRGSDVESIQEGVARAEEGSCEQGEQSVYPSGFDFQHLLVLQDFPLSSFYGVDFNNLNLPLKPSSQVQSFYGLDEESLVAENAALDEFYAQRKCEKFACENDQSSGKQCPKDQNLLFPESASEQDDDFRTLKNLFGYKLYFGSLPYVLDQPATTLGPQHSLLAYLNSELQKGGCINESQLTEKVLKLQTKYKKLVAEKGRNPERQDFAKPGGDYSFFRLSRLTWERDQESDVHQEVDAHCKDTV